MNKKTELIAKKQTMSSNLVMTSSEISQLIAKAGYPHAIAENLIVPTIKMLASQIRDFKQQNQINLLSLYNNTVNRRIVEMIDNNEETIIGRLRRCSFFPLKSMKAQTYRTMPI